jgi:cell division protein FtsB
MLDLHSQHRKGQVVSYCDRSALYDFLVWLAAGAVLLILVVVYASLHNDARDIKVRADRLNRANAELREQNAALRAELSLLTHPERISEQARQLGLVGPNDPSVVTLQVGYTSGRPSRDLVAEAANREKTVRE